MEKRPKRRNGRMVGAGEGMRDQSGSSLQSFRKLQLFILTRLMEAEMEESEWI